MCTVPIHVSALSRQSLGDRHGYSANLCPREPRRNGFVVQSITGFIEATDRDGRSELQPVMLTEAWRVKAGGKAKDFLLVPLEWRVRQNGSMSLEAKIWFATNIDSRLERVPGQVEHFGCLRGSLECLEPPADVPVTTRAITILWRNQDHSSSANHRDYKNGKDLQVLSNKVSLGAET